MIPAVWVGACFLCRMHVLAIVEVHSGAHLVLVLQNYCSKKGSGRRDNRHAILVMKHSRSSPSFGLFLSQIVTTAFQAGSHGLSKCFTRGLGRTVCPARSREFFSLSALGISSVKKNLTGYRLQGASRCYVQIKHIFWFSVLGSWFMVYLCFVQGPV